MDQPSARGLAHPLKTQADDTAAGKELLFTAFGVGVVKSRSILWVSLDFNFCLLAYGVAKRANTENWALPNFRRNSDENTVFPL